MGYLLDVRSFRTEQGTPPPHEPIGIDPIQQGGWGLDFNASVCVAFVSLGTGLLVILPSSGDNLEGRYRVIQFSAACAATVVAAAVVRAVYKKWFTLFFNSP